MPFTATLIQSLSVVDQLAPVSQGAATVNGAAVDMSFFERLIYLVQVGVVGGSGTVAVQIQGSANGTSGWTNITNLVTSSNITTNNQIVKIEVKGEDIGGQGTPYYRYARIVITVGVAASLLSYIGCASIGRHKPENKYNQIAAVAQEIGITP